MTESIHAVDATIRLPLKYKNIVDRSVALLRSKFEKGEVIYLHCFIGNRLDCLRRGDRDVFRYCGRQSS